MSQARTKKPHAATESKPSPRRRVTLDDIGARLGLSGRAVSQALGAPSGTVRISEETREKVVALAKELGYRHNRAARTLRNGRSNLIGVLCEKRANYLELQRLHAATAAINNAGLTPFVYYVTDSTDRAHSAALDILLDHSVDGILSYAFHSTDIDRLNKIGTPICSIDRHTDTPNTSLYLTDKAAAIEELVYHLLQEGCRQLTFLSGPMASSTAGHASSLLEGFRRAKTSSRSRYPRATFAHHTFDSSAISDKKCRAIDLHPLCNLGYFGMLEVIQSGKLPDALLCINDNAAFGAMRACAENGIQIPGDIAVSGFDNDPISSASPIPLTTIAYPLEELARLAVGELVSATQAGSPTRPHTKTRPGKLIVRTSTLRS